MARGASGAAWRIEHDGRRVRAVRPDGVPTVWADGLHSRAAGGVPRCCRSADRRIAASSRSPARTAGSPRSTSLSIDDYLRGVVPLEMGDRPPGDSAAVQAQAVTARSYAYIHLTPSRAPYDVTGGVLDQVYGGVAAETAGRIPGRGVDAVRSSSSSAAAW